MRRASVPTRTAPKLRLLPPDRPARGALPWRRRRGRARVRAGRRGETSGHAPRTSPRAGELDRRRAGRRSDPTSTASASRAAARSRPRPWAAPTLDTQLFLFDADGLGVYANDDSAATSQSTLPAGHPLTPAAPGEYLLGVSPYDRDPQSDAGAIFTNVRGVLGATARARGRRVRLGAAARAAGDYAIALTGTAPARPGHDAAHDRPAQPGGRRPGARWAPRWPWTSAAPTRAARDSRPARAAWPTATRSTPRRSGRRRVTVTARDGAGNETAVTHTAEVVGRWRRRRSSSARRSTARVYSSARRWRGLRVRRRGRRLGPRLLRGGRGRRRAGGHLGAGRKHVHRHGDGRGGEHGFRDAGYRVRLRLQRLPAGRWTPPGGQPLARAGLPCRCASRSGGYQGPGRARRGLSRRWPRWSAAPASEPDGGEPARIVGRPAAGALTAGRTVRPPVEDRARVGRQLPPVPPQARRRHRAPRRVPLHALAAQPLGFRADEALAFLRRASTPSWRRSWCPRSLLAADEPQPRAAEAAAPDDRLPAAYRAGAHGPAARARHRPRPPAPAPAPAAAPRAAQPRPHPRPPRRRPAVQKPTTTERRRRRPKARRPPRPA